MIDFSLKSLSVKAALCSERKCMEMLEGYVCNKLDRNKSYMASYLRKMGNNRWKQSECESLQAVFSINDLLDIEKCEKIFHYFFIQDGLQIHVRSERLIEYTDVGRFCHPYIFIAAYLTIQLEKGNFAEEWCKALSNNILESALPHKHRLPFAENHCHLAGARNNNVMLMSCLDQKNIKKYIEIKNKDKKTKEFMNSDTGTKTNSDMLHWSIFISSFMFLNQQLNDPEKVSRQEFKNILGYLLLKNSLDFPNYLESELGADQIFLLDFSRLCCLCRNELLGHTYPNLLRYALTQYEKNHFDSVLLLYLTCFFREVWNAGKGNEDIQMPFLLFIQELNILRSKIIMSRGTGLADFIQFFNEPLRYVGTHVNNPARSIFMSGTTHCELRLGKLPDKAIIEDNICPEIQRTLENYYPILNCSAKKEFMGYVQDKILFDFGYHFHKSTNKNNGSLKSYSDKARDNQKIKNELLHFFKQEVQNVKITDFENSVSPLSKENLFFDLRLSLRTLDAAGDENLFPPEVFAPVAKAIRNNMFFRENLFNCDFINPNYRQIRRIRFAFHAGEDFTHIVTGMRRVYETIDFFEYEQSDRLGHALAIGLNPLKWVEKHAEVIIPFEEFFDNCVWLHEMAVRMSQQKKDFFAWAVFYEHKISELLEKLSSMPNNLTSQNLFAAYQLRKNLWKCGDGEVDMTNFSQSNVSEEINTFADAYKNRHSGLGKLFEQNVLDIPWEKKILIVFDDHSFFECKPLFLEQEIVRKDEIDFWEAVQDYLLQICADNGIILESNPSSNVAISEIKRYNDHPIFRWSPLLSEDIATGGKYNRFGLRSGRVRVCINSDDPGLFNTTLQNEFYFLEEAAKSYASPEIVRNWIHFIREEGVEIFLDNYISPFSIST